MAEFFLQEFIVNIDVAIYQFVDSIMKPVLNVTQATVLCKNHEKGAVARKHCKAACIGCMKCVKVCEQGAVTVENFLATVDPEKCIGCGKCHEACPVGCIDLITPKGE